MPWEGETPPFGFSDNPDTWLPLPAGLGGVDGGKADRRPGIHACRSIRQAIELRRDRSEFDGTTIEWLDSPADTLAFRRSGGLVCVLNAGTSPDGVARW